MHTKRPKNSQTRTNPPHKKSDRNSESSSLIRRFMESRPWSLPERQMFVQEPSTISPCDRTITIQLRGAVDRSVTVSATDAPFSLCDLPPHCVKFLHRGRIICPSMSFAFLGVEDGDEVFVIGGAPSKPRTPPGLARPRGARDMSRLKKRFDEKWASRFKDPDAVFAQLRDAHDPVTASESSRLTDLFRTRIETSASGFRKMCARMTRLLNDEQCDRPSLGGGGEATVVPEKAICPSTELLPEMWLRSPSAGVSHGGIGNL